MKSPKSQIVNQGLELCTLLEGSKGWSRTKKFVYRFKLEEFIEALENNGFQWEYQKELNWLRSQGSKNSPEQIADKIWGICLSLTKNKLTPA